jgi:HEAT repeats
MSRRVLLRAGLLLLGVVLACGLLALPNVRWPLWAWLRGERFYRGWPTSYYRETLKRPFDSRNGWYFAAPDGYWGVMLPPSPLPLESRPQVAAVYRRLGLTPRPKVVFYLSEVEQVLPMLTELLRDDDARVAANAARILGQMGSRARPAVPALLAAVHHHKDVRVRRAAAYALDSDRIGWWDVRAEVANGLDL